MTETVRNVGILAAAVTLLSTCAAAAIIAVSNSTPEVPASPPVVRGALPFSDRLTRLDGERWSASHGWTNGDWAVNDWQASQARIDGRGLILELAPKVTAKYPFSSGEVQSRHTYGHGYYETRLRAAPGSGVVTGFFTYTGPSFGKPWNEIDVEILGNKPREILFTYFLEGKKRSHIHRVGFDATKEVHHYAFDWQPGAIRWYVDGRLAHEEKGSELPLPNAAQKIMMSVWASRSLTDWVGPFDPSALPTTGLFECVAYSRNRSGGNACR